MIIDRKNIPDYIKFFSSGIENKYNGTNIIYDDSAIVILYYYYTNYKCIYIIKNAGTKTLPFVNNKVEIIEKIEGKYFNRFKKVFKEFEKHAGVAAYLMPNIFYQKLTIKISDKKWNKDLSLLFCLNYKKYSEEI